MKLEQRQFKSNLDEIMTKFILLATIIFFSLRSQEGYRTRIWADLVILDYFPSISNLASLLIHFENSKRIHKCIGIPKQNFTDRIWSWLYKWNIVRCYWPELIYKSDLQSLFLSRFRINYSLFYWNRSRIRHSKRVGCYFRSKRDLYRFLTIDSKICASIHI